MSLYVQPLIMARSFVERFKYGYPFFSVVDFSRTTLPPRKEKGALGDLVEVLGLDTPWSRLAGQHQAPAPQHGPGRQRAEASAPRRLRAEARRLAGG